MRCLGVIITLLMWSALAHANGAINQNCAKGNVTASVSGLSNLPVVPKIVGSYPSCTVTVYLHGTVTLATLYSDDNSIPTPLANPFTANTNGQVFFYSPQGRYDIVLSGTITPPYTISDVLSIDVDAPQQIIPACVALYGYPASPMGTVLTNAMGALPSTGGTVDARCYQGSHTLAGVTVGDNSTKFVTIWLGAVTVHASSAITLNAGSAVVGQPFAGQGPGPGGTSFSGTSIYESNGANLACLFSIPGTAAYLQYMTIDGNLSNNSTAQDNVCVTGLRVSLDHLTTQNAKRHGISNISSGLTTNSAAGLNLTTVMDLDNGGDALYCQDTTDLNATALTQFENSAGYGMELNNCAGVRVVNADVGGNQLAGIFAYGSTDSWTSSQNVIVGNNFGNNYQEDILIHGFDVTHTFPSAFNWTITGNVFIGSTNRAANTYDSIHLIDASQNLIEGNAFRNIAGGNDVRYYVNIEDTASRVQGNLLGGNIYASITGPGTGNFSVTSNTVVLPGAEGNTGLGLLQGAYIGNNTSFRSANVAGSKVGLFTLGGDNIHYLFGEPVQKQIALQPNPGTTQVLLSDGTTEVTSGVVTFDAGTYMNLSQGTGLTLGNGDNNDIAIGTSQFEIITSGPTGSFDVTGFQGGTAGRFLILMNLVNQTFTIKAGSGSMSANQIAFPNGISSPLTVGAAMFVYSTTFNKWMLVSAK